MNTEIEIPKQKVKGLRFGQFIYNAVRKYAKGCVTDADIGSFLYNVENEELQELIDKFYEEYKY